jgi:hypothetical protein
MHIAETRDLMKAVVTELRQCLAEHCDSNRGRRRIELARRQIERIRKTFQRKLDERALYTRGQKWFAVNERESIMRELANATVEAQAAIEAVAAECGHKPA